MRMGSVPTTMVPKPLYRPKKPRVLRMSRTIATPDEPRPLPSTICRVFTTLRGYSAHVTTLNIPAPPTKNVRLSRLFHVTSPGGFRGAADIAIERSRRPAASVREGVRARRGSARGHRRDARRRVRRGKGRGRRELLVSYRRRPAGARPRISSRFASRTSLAIERFQPGPSNARSTALAEPRRPPLGAARSEPRRSARAGSRLPRARSSRVSRASRAASRVRSGIRRVPRARRGHASPARGGEQRPQGSRLRARMERARRAVHVQRRQDRGAMGRQRRRGGQGTRRPVELARVARPEATDPARVRPPGESGDRPRSSLRSTTDRTRGLVRDIQRLETREEPTFSRRLCPLS